MRVLAIDTAGPACSIALCDCHRRNYSVIASRVEAMPRGHAEALLPMIDAEFAQAGIERASIERIAVTVGPGSFTGLRVGVAAARGLALALSCDCVGVSVFAALRETLSPDGAVAVALDARRGEVYLQLFDADGGEMSAPEALPVAEARERVAPHMAVIGSGAALLRDNAEATSITADPVALARIGARLDPASHPPVPLYIRKADAKPQDHVAVARVGGQ